MVSYYNPATAVAMFGRAGTSHYHHHHSPQSQNPYFGSGASAYGGYHHGHTHPHAHPHGPHGQQGSSTGGSPVGVASGIGVGSGLSAAAVSSAQFSPNMATDFNCNHPQYHPHPQFTNITPDPTSWHGNSMYNSACVAARNAAALGVGVTPSAYDEWSASAAVNHSTTIGNPHHPHVHPHHPHHPSFYHHNPQPSPPSSTPSPNSSAHGTGAHSPNNHVYSNSSTTPNNNNPSPSFKAEFGPCSTGNSQENVSQEMEMKMGSQGVIPGNNMGAPHSPDSGMAISDGVSSSGSPATGQQYQNNCLGGPSSSGTSGSSTGSSNPSSSSDPNSMLHHSSSHLHHNQLGGNNNLNQMTVVGHHQSPHINVSNGRPTQARSPYEWMKKPAYSNTVGSSSSNNAKTRTKDKYRVVYSDHQRLELEKEFHYSRYITIRRKAELASSLGLSERQVKIWFQNRRAKERKIHRKRDDMLSREKIATMVHMQNAVGMSAMGGNPMCNQSNNPLMPLM